MSLHSLYNLGNKGWGVREEDKLSSSRNNYPRLFNQQKVSKNYLL